VLLMAMATVVLYRFHNSLSAMKIPSPKMSKKTDLKLGPLGKLAKSSLRMYSRFGTVDVTISKKCLLPNSPLNAECPPSLRGRCGVFSPLADYPPWTRVSLISHVR
jgi:hypothetical protein